MIGVNRITDSEESCKNEKCFISRDLVNYVCSVAFSRHLQSEGVLSALGVCIKPLQTRR